MDDYRVGEGQEEACCSTKSNQASSEYGNKCLVSAKAVKAEKRTICGRMVWNCIRDIQRARRGMVPMRTAAAMNENGNR